MSHRRDSSKEESPKIDQFFWNVGAKDKAEVRKN